MIVESEEQGDTWGPVWEQKSERGSPERAGGVA